MAHAESSHSPARGVTVHQLVVKPVFDALEPREKLHAHRLARAAWHDSRIILRQVSEESPDIFDFIMDLHAACDGHWSALVTRCNISQEELDSFLEYTGMFLCNLGNIYGEGDQKFVPDLSPKSLRKISAISQKTKEGLERIIDRMLSVPPYSLGYPSDNAESAYYPGAERISRQEIAKVSALMEKHSIGPENTRLTKVVERDEPVYRLFQASAETDASGDKGRELADGVFLIRGDYCEELSKVCSALSKCFRTGSQDAFQESQKARVTDTSVSVKSLIGFIEPYRDPAGTSSEWEAMVGIAEPEEFSRMKQLVESSIVIIQQLPWAVEGVNNGKGPFGKSLFEAPKFTSLHALAVCGSIVFEAANLPNYEYIRETCGFKNIVLANRLSANNNLKLPCYCVDPSELQTFRSRTHIVRSITTAVHELLGHGTGKPLSEDAAGVYNFDQTNLPINPISWKPVNSHYLPGQAWNSVFGELAGTVEECRAILMSDYLMDNKETLAIFGYTDDSDITAEDILYAAYLTIGVDGIHALEHYGFESQAWGQVHHKAHFSILKYLLKEGGGVIKISHDRDTSSLTVHVDSSKMISHGKPALGRYLFCLHIWRCTADSAACKEFYEPLCAVDGEYEEWRQIVCSKPNQRWKFVQPNTFVNGEEVEMKTYEESNEGIIQSWVERAI